MVDSGIAIGDLKFDSNISHLASDPNVKISLSSSKQMLAIQGNVVYWYKGDLLSRKFTYETKVVNAFFTHFNIKSETYPNNLSIQREKILAVLLERTVYLYFKDGRSYCHSFPFEIKSGFPYENGIVLERKDSKSVPFVTMTEPIPELGSIVSSSTTSISFNETLIMFPETSDHSITITVNEVDRTLNLYHTRFLHRLNNSLSSSLAGNTKRKPSHPSRKASLANHNEDQSTNQSDEIKVEKKRSISHSGVLSIDRMTSYDFNTNVKSAESNSSTSSTESLRKDAILTTVDSIQLADNVLIQDLDTRSIIFGNKEAVIIKDKGSKLFEILMFDTQNGAVSVPKFVGSSNLSEKYMDFTRTSLSGFIILLSKSNDLELYNPFLNLGTDAFKPIDHLSGLYDSFESQLVAKDASFNILNYNLIMGPKVQIVRNCLNSFKYLTNSYTFNYIWVTWINAFALVKDDWKAFVMTVLASVVPFSVSPRDVHANNQISELLLQIGALQKRAIEDGFSLKDMAPNMILALHLIREDLKLNILNNKIIDDLGLLLAQLTFWMSWSENWYSYYGISLDLLNRSIKFPQLQILETPPDLMQSLTSLFEPVMVPYVTFSQLAQESEQLDEIITPRTFYVLKIFEAIIRAEFTSKDVLNMMAEYNITTPELETFPPGIVVPLSEAIAYCQEYVMGVDEDFTQFESIDRKDLMKLNSRNEETSKRLQIYPQQVQQFKDVHQIISSISDPQEPVAPAEYDRFNVTKLIFSDDRRFYEISKMLQTSKIQVYLNDYSNTLPENELLVRQKELAVLACIRNLTAPLGRSSLFFSSKIPLMTEKFLIPKISNNTLIQPQNVTVTIDMDEVNKEALQWGHFHNGVATGLTISREAKGISGSWIVFNKPFDLNAQHGGFLLGLGLNGHLKSLEEWNIYNYLGPKHNFTSVGLLLGMSASLRGTMDVKLTKVLSVHVVALLPQGASDLIVSVPVQTAGIIGIGLLYLETQHRRMSEILLSQINGKVLIEEKQVAEESYRLAAGLALGYVNLGKGDDLKGLNDAHVVDRLLAISTSMKDIQSEEAFDKSMAGAILALSFIYLKTNNEAISKKLQIPDSGQLLDYIRPDLLLLRVLSKNLILWDSIDTTEQWVESQFPESILDQGRDNLNYYYILSGISLSIAVKYASTFDLTARDTIMKYYDEMTEELDALDGLESFDLRLKRSALLQSQIILALSLSIIMAATGDLETFRRLRILHGKVESTPPQKAYGKFMATNMALGFLFLGGGQYAFNTSSNFAVAALVTSIYPLFPNCDNGEPEVHLQALRHFWSLSIEPRCLVIRDVETSRPIQSEVSIELEDGESIDIKAPCLLPELSTIKKISTLSEEFFKLEIHDLSQLTNLDIYVYKKRKIEVLKKSVELILLEINEKFKKEHPDSNRLLDLKLFENFNKYDVLSFIEDTNETEFKSNIIDRQIELSHLAHRPKTIDDLWNLKLIFAYYDKILNSEDAHYLTLEFVDNLKIQLWSLMNSL